MNFLMKLSPQRWHASHIYRHHSMEYLFMVASRRYDNGFTERQMNAWHDESIAQAINALA